MKITTKSFSRNFLNVSAATMLILNLFACTKTSTTPSKTTTTTPASNTPACSSTIGGNSVTFGRPTASAAGGVVNINASTTTGSFSIVLHVVASSPGTYTLSSSSTGWIATNASIQYITDATHTGSITFTSLTEGGAAGTNVAAGTFNFVANESAPTPGAATENVTGGSFYVTW